MNDICGDSGGDGGELTPDAVAAPVGRKRKRLERPFEPDGPATFWLVVAGSLTLHGYRAGDRVEHALKFANGEQFLVGAVIGYHNFIAATIKPTCDEHKLLRQASDGLHHKHPGVFGIRQQLCIRFCCRHIYSRTHHRQWAATSFERPW